jgi:thioredoxin-related protein
MSTDAPPLPLLPPASLPKALMQAQKSKDRAVAIMVSSAHCPWCGLLINEQLIPRVRSVLGPGLDVVVFDLVDTQIIRLTPPGSSPLQFTPQAWAQAHRYRVAPTLVMVGSTCQPLFEPLVGYSSRDFYGAYLDAQVERAQRYWSQQV